MTDLQDRSLIGHQWLGHFQLQSLLHENLVQVFHQTFASHAQEHLQLHHCHEEGIQVSTLACTILRTYKPEICIQEKGRKQRIRNWKVRNYVVQTYDKGIIRALSKKV